MQTIDSLQQIREWIKNGPIAVSFRDVVDESEHLCWIGYDVDVKWDEGTGGIDFYSPRSMGFVQPAFVWFEEPVTITLSSKKRITSDIIHTYECYNLERIYAETKLPSKAKGIYLNLDRVWCMIESMDKFYQ